MELKAVLPVPELHHSTRRTQEVSVELEPQVQLAVPAELLRVQVLEPAAAQEHRALEPPADLPAVAVHYPSQVKTPHQGLEVPAVVAPAAAV